MSFTRWTDIEGFHNVRKAVNKYELHEGSITYRGKIKLHGTNAGIVVKANGDVFAQSRSAVIGTGNDNAGFAAWVEDTADVWGKASSCTGMMKHGQITIFGEWCGKGVQKGVAISQVEPKQLAIFTIQYGLTDEQGKNIMIVDPREIEKFFYVEGIELPDNVHIIPWYGNDIVVDYADTAILENAVIELNKVVEAVEAEDPWVKEVFGVSGVGEGIVYYPISFQDEFGFITRWHNSTFMMKCKGEKHKGQKDRAAVIIDPEVVASVNEFADKFVTEPRLEQGATEVNRGVLDFDTKLIGPFLKWFNQDVQKESKDELIAAELEWKTVAKEVSKRAREWYLAKVQEI